MAAVTRPGGDKKAAPPPHKEKNSRAPKASAALAKEKQPKASSPPSHPPYFEMIKEAIVALNEKTGSSPRAIAKFMEEKHKAVLPANYKKMISNQLKNATAKGKLLKIKASFKLSDSGKVSAAKKTKKPSTKAEKPAVKKPEKEKVTAGTKRKAPAAAAGKKTAPQAAAVKSTTKIGKTLPAKPKPIKSPVKPKQPKSINSPAAKRARRAI